MLAISVFSVDDLPAIDFGVMTENYHSLEIIRCLKYFVDGTEPQIFFS